MRSKVVELEQAVAAVKDGQTILFGDWHGEISAEEVITGVIEKGVKDITAVAVSGGMPDQGVGRMIVAKQVKALKTTHIGLNPVARDQMPRRRAGCRVHPAGHLCRAHPLRRLGPRRLPHPDRRRHRR